MAYGCFLGEGVPCLLGCLPRGGGVPGHIF